MAMIPTGLLAGLGGLARTAATALAGGATRLLPYANLALGAYGAYSAAKSVAKTAMPGGAPIDYYGGSPMYSSGYSGANLGLNRYLPIPTPGSPYGGIGEPGGFFGGSTQVVPQRVSGGYRLPHQIMVPHPSQPGLMRTYVLAPMVRYRVSIRAARRRHWPGGR